MPTADPEPLSDERLDMLEDDFRAGRGCFSGWGLALVAEVRQLRTELQGFRDDDGVSGTPEGDYMWNVVRLRRLLLKRGDHEFMCMAKFNDGPCSCGWSEERAELSGESHEQREGEGP